jgi:branched-subunit amino acid transport protein
MTWAGLPHWADPWTLLTIAGLALLTLLTRALFLISERPFRLPGWVERGLQYAPIAALSAVVVPEVAMAQGELLATWQDARLFGAAAGVLMFFWRRSIFGTILCGMAVYLPLRLGLGW